MIKLAQNLLILTHEAATQKFAFVGSNGSGKSYAATKLGEEMLKTGVQIIVIDPVGIWHGLRRTADGTPSAFNVLVFGGLHGDLPLTSSMAKAIAHSMLVAIV
ncbi:MAG: ATP-binding protein [Leptolyngbya sp. Prado105]|jgi:DNA helicase HerA-like ATPase|nr:ATP-binding protein [Leptolyngbya sp. Prado105]